MSRPLLPSGSGHPHLRSLRQEGFQLLWLSQRGPRYDAVGQGRIKAPLLWGPQHAENGC